MKQNIELGGLREFGDIISDSFKILIQNFKPLLKTYFAICGVFLVAAILVSIVFRSQHTYEGTPSVFSFWGLLSLVFSTTSYTVLILSTLCYLALYKDKGNRAPQVMEVWGYFKYYFFRVLGTQFLLLIFFFIGFMLCFLPGIYLLPVFSLVIPIMVMENSTAEYAIRKAFKIIKENWWFTFGVFLLLSVMVFLALLVVVVPIFIVYGGAQWLTGKAPGSTFVMIETIVPHVCQIFWMLPTIASALVYYTLTEQKDASNLVSRIKMFGKKDADPDQFSADQY